MRLSKFSVSGFRGLRQQVALRVDDFTVLVGKNGAGKSSVVDALEIALGDAKMATEDVPAQSSGHEARPAIFRAYFDQLPSVVGVDAGAVTSLEAEGLLTADGALCIETVCAVTTAAGAPLARPKAPERFIVCNHFSGEGTRDLLQLKNAELKARVRDAGIDAEVDLTNNVAIRAALRDHHGAASEARTETRIPVDGGDAKPIWDALTAFRPRVVTFRADRESTDQDSEAQDPIKDIVAGVLEKQQEALAALEREVSLAIEPLLSEAIEFFADVEPDLAKKLSPSLAPPAWAKAFRFALRDDSEIAVNRWSSGARRLLLISLFRAQTVREVEEGRPTLHLVEEPETALHPRLQRRLVRTLMELADTQGHQVLVTTHSPGLVHDVDAQAVRVLRSGEEIRAITEGDTKQWRNVARDLGVTPDGRVRAFLCVEGPTDESGLMALSKAMRRHGLLTWDIEEEVKADRLLVVLCGGSTLGKWLHRLSPLSRPEVHWYDSDREHESHPGKSQTADTIVELNARDGVTAFSTRYREMENYFGPGVIARAFSGLVLPSAFDWRYGDVPSEIGQVVGANQDRFQGLPSNGSKIKNRLVGGVEDGWDPAHLPGEAIQELTERFAAVRTAIDSD